jgi:DNA-binding response OmpR family regulator
MNNLLVVDDEPSLLEALTTILADAGYQVQAVTSGQAALQALKASKGSLPDLIIADIVMFEMTGLQLFEVVRGCPDLSHVPFLFTSAFVSPEREELIAGLNNATLLFKPFEVEELLNAIEAICGTTPNH